MNARCSYQSTFMLLRFLSDLSCIICNTLFLYSSIHLSSRLLRDWDHSRARDNKHLVLIKLLLVITLLISSSFRHDRLFIKFLYQSSFFLNQISHLIEFSSSFALHQIFLLIKLFISNFDIIKFYTCFIQCCIHVSFSAQYTLHFAFDRKFSEKLDESLTKDW